MIAMKSFRDYGNGMTAISPNPKNPVGRLDGLMLHDQTQVIARELIPADRAALADAYRRLSPTSRYNRFWTHGGDVIGDRMLDRVLKQDLETHVSWAILDPARESPPMGAASWWRDDASSTEAEFSAVVIDADQGRGVGTLLLAILWCLAIRAGIQSMVAYSLTENRQAANWMRDTGAAGHWDGHKLVFRWDISNTKPAIDTRAARDFTARIKEVRECL